jgi:hypothetical protein
MGLIRNLYLVTIMMVRILIHSIDILIFQEGLPGALYVDVL